MRRDEFTAKTRDQAATRANGRCELCGLPFAGERPVFDHILPAEYGGKPTLANCQALHVACHAAKTRRDIRSMRKADRVRRSNNGAELPKPPIAARAKPEKLRPDKLPIPPPLKIYKETT